MQSSSARHAYRATLHFSDAELAAYPVERVVVDETGVTMRYAHDVVDATVLTPIVIPTESTVAAVEEVSTVPEGASIGYQVTKDYRAWYFFDGTQWRDAYGCSRCTNSAIELATHLPSFLDDEYRELTVRVHMESGVEPPRLEELVFVLSIPEETPMPVGMFMAVQEDGAADMGGVPEDVAAPVDVIVAEDLPDPNAVAVPDASGGGEEIAPSAPVVDEALPADAAAPAAAVEEPRGASRRPGDWDHSELSIAGVCASPEVVFTMTNTGTGDMAGASEYRIFRADALETSGTVQLAAGASTTVAVTANGDIVRGEVDQRPGNPGRPYDSDEVRNCAPTVNLPPVAVDDAVETVIDTAVEFDALVNDSDPDGNLHQATVEVLTLPTHGTVEIRSGTDHFVYTPFPAYIGEDSLVYLLCDVGGLCDTATVSMTVTETPNQPPVATDDDATTTTGVLVAVDVLANDRDPEGMLDVASLAIVEGREPRHGTAVVHDDIVDYTSEAAFTGVDAFDYRICDDRGVCDTARATINVYPPNTPPVATDDTATVGAGFSITAAVLANDADPDGVLVSSTLAIVAFPLMGDAAANTGDGTVTYTANADAEGVDTLIYRICDDDGACDEATLSVTVVQYRAPTVVDDAVTTPRNVALTFDVLVNDNPGSGAFDVSSLTTSGEMLGTVTVAPEAGTLMYEPPAGFSGAEQFAYRICNTIGLCDDGAVYVSVTSPHVVGSSPQTSDDHAQTRMAEPVLVNFLANDTDPDGGRLQVVAVDTPLHGSVAFAGDAGFTYTPFVGFFGTDTFTYRACDAAGMCGFAVVTVLVHAPPVANDDGAVVAAGGMADIDVRANDLDPDGTAAQLTVALTAGPQRGIATLLDDGMIRYRAGADASGIDEFAYQICDAFNLCDTATVRVAIAAYAPPVANDDAAQLRESSAVSVNLLANDSDPDGGTTTLVVEVITEPYNGTATLTDGVLTYVPTRGFRGTDVVTYRACDGDGLCDEATITLIVYAEESVSAPRGLVELPLLREEPFVAPVTTALVITGGLCGSTVDADEVRVAGVRTATAGQAEYSLTNGESWNAAPITSGGWQFTLYHLAPGEQTLRLRLVSNDGAVASAACTFTAFDEAAAGASELHIAGLDVSHTETGARAVTESVPHAWYLEATGATAVAIVDAHTDERYDLQYDSAIKLWRADVALEEEGVREVTAEVTDAEGTVHTRAISTIAVAPQVRVVDAVTRVPVRAARVTILQKDALTEAFVPWDAQTYAMKNPVTVDTRFPLVLPQGEYVFDVTAEGYGRVRSPILHAQDVTTFSGEIALAPGGVVTVLRSLAGDGGSVEVIPYASETMPSIQIGAPMPAVTWVDGDTRGGLRIGERPVLVAVVSAWGMESQEVASTLDALARDPKRSVDVQVLTTVEPDEVVRGWQARGAYVFPLAALDAEWLDALSIGSLPAFYLVDHNQVIRGYRVGSLSQDELGAWLGDMLQ